jgi:hypothetical protein
MRVVFFLLLFSMVLRAESPRYVVTLVPENNTFPHWRYDYGEKAGFLASMNVQFKAPFRGVMEYAVCSISNEKEKWRFPGTGEVLHGMLCMTQGGNFSGGIYFEKNFLDDFGDGTFLFAILIDGVRCSNVIRVRIQHDYDPAKEPPLRVFAIQPLNGNEIQRIGVWVVPPVESKKLTNFVADIFAISINDQWHLYRPIAWRGLDMPLPAHVSAAQNCFFDLCTPPISPFKRARVQVRLLNYLSAVTELSFDPTDSERLDRTFGL